MIWWRSPGGKIHRGISLGWVGGPIIHIMPWSKRWRLRIRWRFYIWSDHEWQMAKRIVDGMDAAGIEHRALTTQPPRYRVWAPSFSCEVIRPT